MLQLLLIELCSNCQTTFVTPPKKIVCSSSDPKLFSLPPPNCHCYHDQNEVLCEPLFCAIYDQFTNITVHVQVAVCYDQTAWIVE